MKETPPLTITFTSPRLSLTLPSRYLFRLLNYISYVLLIAGTTTLLIADIPSLKWLGLLLLLILLDKIKHLGQAESNLLHLGRKNEINSANFLSPRSFQFL